VRGSRWLIVAPALVAIVWSFVSPVSADPVQGLDATYYVIDEVPPVKSDSLYPVCGSELENNINRSYDGEPYLDCTNDLFMVHMTGFITIPAHETIEFWLASDDGGVINIDGNEWGNWGDQGCSATESGQIDIVAGSQPLDVWMYENGGGTCLMLAWNINNEGWSMVPDEAFTTDYQQPVQTTIPDTTIPDTTMPETTTTWTTTTTSTIAESTTVPATNPSTTSIPQTTSIYLPPPTMPPPPATVPLPPIPETTPPDTQPAPPETLPVVLEPLLPPIPDTMPEPPATLPTIPLPPDTMPLPLDTMPPPPDTLPLPPDTLPEAPQAPETSEPAEDEELPPISDEAVVEALADIEQATTEEVKAIVTELLAFALTTDQAVSVASEPAVLAVLTNEEAAQVFEQVAVEELTTEQAVELVAAVQEAPTKVRKAFEAVLNLFEGFADDYTMTNQTVPIKTRRALIALGAVFLVSAPAPIRRNR
jgi:hypothetical protein